MLEMRAGCECCDGDLPPDSADAMICSFECTFCRPCASGVLRGRCPNCGGGLFQRPPRAAQFLDRHPPRADRVVKPGGCQPAF